MSRFVIAVLAGIALGPIELVFSPLYFPWTLLIVVSAGLLVGIAGSAGGLGARLSWSVLAATALFVVGTVAIGQMNGGSLSVALIMWLLMWLLVPVVAGTVVGAVAREKLGPLRAPVVVAGGIAAVALIGAALALILAPPEVAHAPACESSPSCDRVACWMMAERTRWLAVERVTAYGAGGITCVYTSWGGIHVGTVVSAPGAGSSWEDGWWPRRLRTWDP